MDLELRHLRAFVAVAEELHFGRAAERLHIAQPPLSRTIRQLEAVVGAELFTRTSRSVALTAAGSAFLERARRLLAQAADGVEEAGRIGRGEDGLLDVGFVSSAIALSVPHRIRAFRDRYPSVRVRLQEGTTAQTIGRLLRREIDVAMARDAEPHPALTNRIVATEPFVAVLPASHPRACAARIAASTLRDEPFVFYAPSAGALAYERNLAPCTEAGYAPRIVQEAAHWLTLFHLVDAGLGVTIAPTSAAGTLPDGVRRVALRGTRARSEVQLVTRVGDERAVVRNFSD